MSPSRMAAVALAATVGAASVSGLSFQNPGGMTTPAETYVNPVGGDIRMGDPFVSFYDGRYTLVGTNYQDGFRAFTSGNLVDWQPAGVIWRDETGACRGSYWAPEIHAWRGQFYLVFSCQMDLSSGSRGYRLGLAVADRVTGPYRTVALPWFEDFGSNIDAHVFIDADRPYLFFDKVGATDGVIWGQLFAVELDPTLERALDEPVFVSGASQPWEKPGSRNETNEGAFVFKRGGRYYLTYSGNGYRDPDYGIGYQTAASPLGPWTKSQDNPVLARDEASGVSGPGHSSMVPSPDGTELFIVYHAHGDPAQPGSGRTVNIDRVRFDAEGRLDVAGPTRTPQPVPSGSPVP